MVEKSLSFADKMKIYFRTVPFIVGEVLLIVGLVVLMQSQGIELVVGLVLMAVGGYLVWRKVSMLSLAKNLVATGCKTKAKLVDIMDTSVRHNQRTVKKYFFEYFINGQKRTFLKKSAYLRPLKLGDELIIFCSKTNIEETFVPLFYSIKKID